VFLCRIIVENEAIRERFMSTIFLSVLCKPTYIYVGTNTYYKEKLDAKVWRLQTRRHQKGRLQNRLITNQ